MPLLDRPKIIAVDPEAEAAVEANHALATTLPMAIRLPFVPKAKAAANLEPDNLNRPNHHKMPNPNPKQNEHQITKAPTVHQNKNPNQSPKEGAKTNNAQVAEQRNSTPKRNRRNLHLKHPRPYRHRSE